MRVVVAGATGLIGSRTVAGLRDHGAEVVPRHRTADAAGTAAGRTGPVVADPRVPFFGVSLEERTLLPGPDAHLGHHTFAQWLKQR
ncbi:hypothetical protein [Streptomyces sp. NPDC088812]|uniref:hypothetical protein n=1 Tax=Streptomyces sp. NPDC088812 TaxID=3365905 RepID=UPI00380202A9